MFSFCGEWLEYSESVTHLGHILSSDLSDNLDVIAVSKACAARQITCSLSSGLVTLKQKLS